MYSVHKNFLQSICISMVLLVSATASMSLKERILNGRIRRSTTTSDLHTVTEGHDIQLVCNARGTTPPIIHWLFNGRHVEQGPLDHVAENIIPPSDTQNFGESEEDGRIYSSISTLNIKNATSRQDGRYTCIADLPGERKTKTYNVFVRSAEGHFDLSIKRSAALVSIDNNTRIYLYTASALENEGVSTVLICRATQGSSSPVPSIAWSIDETPITNSTSGYQIMSNGDLKILRTSYEKHHMRGFKCRAEGEGGKFDEKRPFVYLLEPEPEQTK